LDDEPMKWYDHETDMIKYSLSKPDVLFVLDGDGEDSGDIWRKYFKNGKMQPALAKIVFDNFDETKLR